MSRTGYDTGQRYHAASTPPPETTDQVRCGGCARRARHAGERAELETNWILSGPGGPEIRHFCRDCAPTGPVADLPCIHCGDGPLLAGDVAEHPERAEALLVGAGWRLDGPTCPSCVPRRSRTADRH